MNQNKKPLKAAHFLLIPELLYSPPNDAIIRAYIEEGYQVDVYSPAPIPDTIDYGSQVSLYVVAYSWKWIIKNLASLRWLRYSILSGTSEDPLGVIGVYSYIYRKASICLVDEIKAGSYRGDRSNHWKSLCKWAIRRANLRIVNDQSRIQLLNEYADLPSSTSVLVYPGCFKDRPRISGDDREKVRNIWGFNNEAFLIGSSGGFNLTAGAEWIINALKEYQDLHAVIQPLGISDLALFLLQSIEMGNRIYLEKSRLSWREAWYCAQGLDVGVSIYSNPAPQFQNMGISSNRLCMFIAMGVPVVASKQESFTFLERYDCGILVDSYDEFCNAIKTIRSNHDEMRHNCERCFNDYIHPNTYYKRYVEELRMLKKS